LYTSEAAETEKEDPYGLPRPIVAVNLAGVIPLQLAIFVLEKDVPLEEEWRNTSPGSHRRKLQ